MKSEKAEIPEKVRLTLSDGEWDTLQRRVDYGRRAAAIAFMYGSRFDRTQTIRGDSTVAVTLGTGVAHDESAGTYSIVVGVEQMQTLALSLTFADLEDRARAYETGVEPVSDDASTALHSELHDAMIRLRIGYEESQGERYPEMPIDYAAHPLLPY